MSRERPLNGDVKPWVPGSGRDDLADYIRTWQGRFPPLVTQKVPPFDTSSSGSRYLREVGIGGAMHIAGSFKRQIPVRNKLKDDITFSNFCQRNSFAWEDEWGVTDLNFAGLYKSIAKYNKPSPTLSEEQRLDLATATQWTTAQYRPHLLPCIQYTVEEVVDRVDMSKSPGFPWNTAYKTSLEAWQDNKEWFVTNIEDHLAGRRDLPIPIYNIFAKEELLPADKIAIGKVRSISGCGLEYKLFVDCVLLSQNECFYSAHNSTRSEVGINPFNNGWERLYEKLYVPGWLGLSLDVSGFDANFSAVMSRAVAEVRYNCLPTDARNSRSYALIHEITALTFNGLIIMPWGELLLKDHGNASGSPCTVVDNTLALDIGLCYSWIRCCRYFGRDVSYPDFVAHVKAALYGDDNTLVTSPESKQWFTIERITQAFKELGWDITLESDGWQEVIDLNFLQRGFLRVGTNSIVPVPLDGNKALSSLLHKGGGDVRSTYVRACGLLMNYFWCHSIRRILNRFLDSLEVAYFKESNVDNERLKRNRKTDSEIIQLYLDPEWSGGVAEGLNEL